jgi:hypothetical protein
VACRREVVDEQDGIVRALGWLGHESLRALKALVRPAAGLPGGGDLQDEQRPRWYTELARKPDGDAGA